MKHFGHAWLALSVALGVHVADEAAHDFLGWYNPTVEAIRQRAPWLPLPTFGFTEWITGLAFAVGLLLCLSVLAYAANRVLRAAAVALGALMTLNGAAHIAVSVWNGRLMPGVLSSPLLIACAVWLVVSARRV